MSKTTAPQPTPSPREVKTPGTVGSNPGSQFVGMAVDMGWRLAATVLVPIIGGFELDKALKTSPWLTVLGFLLALAGTALIFWQTLQVSGQSAKTEKRS
jgi:F0F1-type ATP synthase assembly protein I